MATVKTPQGAYIRKILTEFPESSSRALARKAVQEEPTLFKSAESARGLIREYRGRSGTTITTQFPKSKWTADPFKDFHDGRREVDGWGPFVIDGPEKILVLSDPHTPYHEKTALVAAVKYGQKFNPSIVVLNGDFMDFKSVSHWLTDPREKDFPGELVTGREFLQCIRKAFPKARIIAKEGNHEMWWEQHLYTNAPAIVGCEDFELESLLRMNDVGIEYVKSKRLIQAGKMLISHGHEWRFAISNPVNPARGLFTRALTHAMCGHFHQRSEHTEVDATGHSIVTYSMGCLCYLHPQFQPHNKWTHGFVSMELDKGGAFDVSNHKIIHGKVY